MSGTRATFTLKKDAKVDEKALKAALEKSKITFNSLTSRNTEPAKEAWVLECPGLT